MGFRHIACAALLMCAIGMTTARTAKSDDLICTKAGAPDIQCLQRAVGYLYFKETWGSRKLCKISEINVGDIEFVIMPAGAQAGDCENVRRIRAAGNERVVATLACLTTPQGDQIKGWNAGIALAKAYFNDHNFIHGTYSLPSYEPPSGDANDFIPGGAADTCEWTGPFHWEPQQ